MVVSIKRVLEIDDLEEQRAAATPEVKKEWLIEYVKHHTDGCELLRDLYKNTHNWEFDDWDGNPETLPMLSVSTFRMEKPLVTGLPADDEKLMEMVKRGELKLYESSGSSRTGVTSRVYKDMETFERSLDSYVPIMRDYCHLGESSEPEFEAMFLPPPGGTAGFPDTYGPGICERLGVKYDTFFFDKETGKLKFTSPKEATEETIRVIEELKEISKEMRLGMLAAPSLANMVLEENERIDAGLKFEGVRIGGGFKDPREKPAEVIAKMKRLVPTVLEDSLNYFTDCFGMTESNEIMCSPRQLDANLNVQPPIIGYFQPLSPFTYTQVRSFGRGAGKVLKNPGDIGQLGFIDLVPRSYPAIFLTGDEVEIIKTSEFGEPEIIKYIDRIPGVRPIDASCGYTVAEVVQQAQKGM